MAMPQRARPQPAMTFLRTAVPSCRNIPVRRAPTAGIPGTAIIDAAALCDRCDAALDFLHGRPILTADVALLSALVRAAGLNVISLHGQPVGAGNVAVAALLRLIERFGLTTVADIDWQLVGRDVCDRCDGHLEILDDMPAFKADVARLIAMVRG
jgi:hypothetical protein